MSHLRRLLNRLVYAFTATLIAWVTCTMPTDRPHAVLTWSCRIFSWPIRVLLARNNPLSTGWCDFCAADERLWRTLLTGVPIYLVLLYVPALVMWIVRRRTRAGGNIAQPRPSTDRQK